MNSLEILHLNEEMVNAYLDLAIRIDSESNFMLYNKNERPKDEKYKNGIVDVIIRDKSNQCLLAKFNGDICGYIIGLGSNLQKKRHIINIVIGVLQKFQNNGVGSFLLKHLTESYEGFKVFHLSVAENNRKAISFYKKNGFTESGFIRHSLRIDDHFINEMLMHKICKHEKN